MSPSGTANVLKISCLVKRTVNTRHVISSEVAEAACLVQRRGHGEVRVLHALVRRVQDAGADAQALGFASASVTSVRNPRSLLILLS